MNTHMIAKGLVSALTLTTGSSLWAETAPQATDATEPEKEAALILPSEQEEPEQATTAEMDEDIYVLNDLEPCGTTEPMIRHRAHLTIRREPLPDLPLVKGPGQKREQQGVTTKHIFAVLQIAIFGPIDHLTTGAVSLRTRPANQARAQLRTETEDRGTALPLIERHAFDLNL